jgi:hypothetical protein
MAAQDFDFILRVQADLQTAVTQLRTLNDQMRVVKSSATEASGGLQSITTAAKGTQSAVRVAGAELKSLGASVGGIGRNLRTLTAAFASLFAVRELAGFVKNVIDADQAIGDLSNKVGVSTETLTALSSVAKRSGADVTAVQGAFVNLARAATGQNANGVKALQAMNISLAQFRALSPAQQFDLVAQKFAGYSDGANKAALATALFGRAGADLIPTLNTVGQQGLQNLTDKAVAAGTAVGKDAVTAAQAFGNAMQTLQEHMQGAVNQGLAQLTPEIENLSQLFENPQFAEGVNGIATALATLAAGAAAATGKIVEFIGNAREVVDFAQTGGAVYSNATSQIAQIRVAADRAELAARTSGNNSPFSQLGRGIFTTSDSQTRAAFMSTEKLSAEIATLTQRTTAYTKSRDGANKANAQAGDTRGLSAGLPGNGKTNAPIIDLSGASEKIAKQAAAAQDALTQSLIALQGQLSPTAAIYAKYNDAVAKATTEALLAKQAHGADAQAIDAQRDAVIDLAGKVRDAALDQLAEQDRQAWERLRRSFETPAQVAVDDAMAKIAKLDDLLQKGVINSAQYQDALGKIGTSSVTAAPQYHGPGAAVGGPFGELQKNFQAGDALEAWHQQQMAANQAFRAKDAANETAYQARIAGIEQQYGQQRTRIEQARQQLYLSFSANFFGELAGLSSSSNKKIAAIGKTAAIAQTIIQTYQSATEAYSAMASIPYVGPALGVAAAAAAIAAGLANVAQIRAQPTGGYADGGYTGAGGKYQVAGVVHAGEGVLSQRDIAALGGPRAFEAFRTTLRGYADGGLVSPLHNAPSPAQMGFPTPTQIPLADMVGAATAARGSAAPAATNVKVVMVQDMQQAVIEAINTPAGTKAVIQKVGDNPQAIQGKWSR